MKIFKGEDGYFIASAEEFGLFTQGKTFEELLKNIKEAAEVTFGEREDQKSGQGVMLPPIMMNIDYSEVAHA